MMQTCIQNILSLQIKMPALPNNLLSIISILCCLTLPIIAQDIPETKQPEIPINSQQSPNTPLTSPDSPQNSPNTSTPAEPIPSNATSIQSSPITDTTAKPPATPNPPPAQISIPNTSPIMPSLWNIDNIEDTSQWRALKNQIVALEARLRLLEEKETATREREAILKEKETAQKKQKAELIQNIQERILALELSIHQLRTSEATHRANILALYQQGQQFQINQITSLAQRIEHLEREQIRATELSKNYEQIAYACFQNKQWKMACLYLQLALQINPQLDSACTFLTTHWGELNTPENMLYIPTEIACLGDTEDPEYPYQTLSIQHFYLDKTEVTNKQFAEFVRQAYQDNQHWTQEGIAWRKDSKAPANFQFPTPEQENLPVVNINFYEAEAYSHFVDKRLPTAEEWEYAARGTDARRYPWGNQPPQWKGYFRTNYFQKQSPFDNYEFSAPVNFLQEDCSAFGILGMAGNVSEWTQSIYTIPKSGRMLKMIKGGSFHHTSYRLQSFTYFAVEPNHTTEYIGFRCAKDVPAQPQ